MLVGKKERCTKNLVHYDKKKSDLQYFCPEPKLVQIHLKFSKKNLSLERMETLELILII